MPLHICPNQGNYRISIAGHASYEPVTNEKIPFRLMPERVVNNKRKGKELAQSWAEVLTPQRLSWLKQHSDAHSGTS